MAFNDGERNTLLALKGVGATVLQRLEQMGLGSFALLAQAQAEDVLAQGAALTGSTCWQNSPQARAAVQACIDAARTAIADQ